eukprot:CAMPEP_0184647852 /NCGR_PEP_ID=MMETSP0308-20130426/4868_1 /TAXON_ID=38269 /ORGANISM="Gloeochaete witrockiana, Strain SAG 46.84" /LENGTH=537 /DNA_ID=CAMNT_0027079197 /DNA_START=47 /DNA_END=1657 /DNA_ORIENTATION=-
MSKEAFQPNVVLCGSRSVKAGAQIFAGTKLRASKLRRNRALRRSGITSQYRSPQPEERPRRSGLPPGKFAPQNPTFLVLVPGSESSSAIVDTFGQRLLDAGVVVTVRLSKFAPLSSRNVMLVDSHSYSKFTSGRCGLRPAVSNNVGLVIDGGIDVDARFQLLQKVDVIKKRNGLTVSGYSVTDMPIELDFSLAASFPNLDWPSFFGNSESLLRTCQKVGKVSNAIAVITDLPENAIDSKGKSLSAGADHAVCRLVGSELNLPSIHVPYLSAERQAVVDEGQGHGLPWNSPQQVVWPGNAMQPQSRTTGNNKVEQQAMALLDLCLEQLAVSPQLIVPEIKGKSVLDAVKSVATVLEHGDLFASSVDVVVVPVQMMDDEELDPFFQNPAVRIIGVENPDWSGQSRSRHSQSKSRTSVANLTYDDNDTPSPSQRQEVPFGAKVYYAADYQGALDIIEGWNYPVSSPPRPLPQPSSPLFESTPQLELALSSPFSNQFGSLYRQRSGGIRDPFYLRRSRSMRYPAEFYSGFPSYSVSRMRAW